MCYGRLFHRLVLGKKKKCRWESTEDWGIWSVSLLYYVTLSTGMRSSRGISIVLALAFDDGNEFGSGPTF